MQGIKIDPEFQDLLPALDKQVYEALEASILEHGCRDPLVTWQGYLIDGHNRLSVCQAHGIPFKTVEKEFCSRDEVLAWIIKNQMSRRNLTPMQYSNYLGRLYNLEKQSLGGKKKSGEGASNPQNEDLKLKTSKRIGDEQGVASSTVERCGKLNTTIDAIGKVSPEARRKILTKDVPIDKRTLEALAPKAEVEDKEPSSEDKEKLKKIEKLALSIEGGTYEKETYRTPASSKTRGAPGDSSFNTTTNKHLPPANPAVKELTDEFYLKLQRLTKENESAQLQANLQLSISILEALYELA